MQDTYISLDPKLADYYAIERAKERYNRRAALAEAGIGSRMIPLNAAFATVLLVLANQPEKTRGLAGLTNRATLSKLAVLGLGTYYFTSVYVMTKFGDTQRK